MSDAPSQWLPAGITSIKAESPDFQTTTQRWNAYKGPTFKEAVTPANADEVAAIVKAARAVNLPFLATGGRHGYSTTFEKLKGGLAIDLSKLRSVVVDKANETVTVGGGATIQDVTHPVAEAGFQLPSGSCNTVGFTATALGAGIGTLQGLFGLVSDALISAELVTASGEKVTASEEINSDLFWALRGAGANFGIVTSATYKLSKQVNGGQVFHAEMMFVAAQQEEYFKILEEFEVPPELGFSSTIFWEENTESTGILSTFVYIGPEPTARKVLKPFFDLQPMIPVTETVPFQRIPDVVLLGLTETACHTHNGLHSIIPVNVKQWPASTWTSVFEQFDAFLQENEDARKSVVIMETLSNAAAIKVPDELTAYPWRDATGYIMFQMRWNSGFDSPFGDTTNNFARKLRSEVAATSGYDGLAAYVNYAWGDETLEQVYRSDKLPRLRELKKKWDPDNVFGYSVAIPAE